jgi:hypothetical protein
MEGGGKKQAGGIFFSDFEKNFSAASKGKNLTLESVDAL